MTTGTLSIQSEHIMPIIKKWLYSEKAYNSCAERARRTADQGGRDASRNRSIGITAIAITFRRIQSTRTPR